MALINVIIPVYNCEQFLEEAINSVLNQSFKDINIILVDDGSTDNSPSLCDTLEKNFSNINVIHQKNSGVSKAKNKGIDYFLKINESGYFIFLDADDAWEENFICDEVLKLLNQKNDLIGFQSQSCDEKLNKTGKLLNLEEGIFSGGKDSIWKHSTQHFGSMFYSVELLKKYKIRFDESLNYSEDKIFIMQCMYLADSIVLKNRLLYLYRQNSNSVMHKRKRGIEYYEPIIKGY